MYYLLSIVLGLIPEVLYFVLFLSYSKNLKGKKIRLFLATLLVYFCCMLIVQYQLFFYILFIVLFYIILKIFYKKKIQIVDLFLIMYASSYLTLLSFLIYLVNDAVSYWILYCIDRILMFMPFIFKNKFNLIYKKYYSFWNRDYTQKKAIKSITLRNITLILINCIIFIMNIICIYMFKI